MQIDRVQAGATAVAPSASFRAAQELGFTLQDLKQAIPGYCFQPSTARSLAYFAFDLGLIAGLYALAYSLNSWLFFPVFWVAQGTMFWALFVVGHDCGHGSFSRHPWLNSLVGHLSHTPILVPYHGWRISHRTHHANTGNIDTDESWYPLRETTYRSLPIAQKLVRFYGALLAYPLYLFFRSPGRKGSHFIPSSPLFRPAERRQVWVSTLGCAAMVTALVGLGISHGWLFLATYYIAPYLVFVVWLDFVTWLHHTEADIPWYGNDDWYFLKGALSTIDRDYGFINPIHHHIGTHVAHHIFSSIPHYHLKAATAAIKPVLGDYYRVSTEPVWQSFWRSYWDCRYVADHGSPLYYQPEAPGQRPVNQD